jgi:hypothetical protein
LELQDLSFLGYRLVFGRLLGAQCQVNRSSSGRGHKAQRLVSLAHRFAPVSVGQCIRPGKAPRAPVRLESALAFLRPDQLVREAVLVGHRAGLVSVISRAV